MVNIEHKYLLLLLKSKYLCIEPDETKALKLLRQLTGKPQAHWTSDLQWEAIQHVYNLDKDVLLVMATGGGKTMVAIIPTLMDQDVSILVLPLNSLITDYKRKFAQMGLQYDHYTSQTQSLRTDVHFIIVSADMAQTARWTECLMDLNSKVDVTRLIFDEAHLVLTGSDFRNSLTHVNDLRKLSMQFVLLSGTAPPSAESALCAAFGLGSNKIILRGPTDRPELCYIRLPQLTTFDDVSKMVKRLITQHQSTSKPEDRVLIFVPYLDLGEALSQFLNCEFYHGGIKNPSLRESMYLRWFSGPNTILIATSSLSAGNDHQHVRLVIHANTPLEMMNYVQEISRGGRDGEPTKCFLLPMFKKKITGSSLEVDYKGVKAMHDFVWETTTCLRYAITEFSDGQGVFCRNDPKRQLCSNCKAARPPPNLLSSSHSKQLPLMATNVQYISNREISKPLIGQKWAADQEQIGQKRKAGGKTRAFEDQFQIAKRARVEREIEDIEYVNRFKLALALFQSSCSFCMLHGKQVTSHSIVRCPTLGPRIPDYKQWKGSLKIGGKGSATSCYFCHVPQCNDQLHPAFSRPESCQYPDIVAPIAFGIFFRQDLRAQAEGHFQTQWPTLHSFSKWLGGPVVPLAKTNISALFLWYADMTYNV